MSTRSVLSTLAAVSLAASGLLACTDKGGEDSGGTDGDGGTDAFECEATEPACLDDLIADLSFQDDEVSDGGVTNTTDGDDYVSVVDASAGGYNSASTNPWVYVAFTADGLEKIEIDDEASLEDLTWDLGMRRYLVRTNGGDAGPGCVATATFREKTYEEVDLATAEALVEGGDLNQDDFYTDSCEIINDSSGLEGSPNLVLGQWWSYPGCVATSGYPHVIQTSDGGLVKVVFEAYYGEGQEDCNATGVPGSDSAQIQLRWQKLK